MEHGSFSSLIYLFSSFSETMFVWQRVEPISSDAHDDDCGDGEDEDEHEDHVGDWNEDENNANGDGNGNGERGEEQEGSFE